MARSTTRITTATAANPGAVGVIQLAGPDTARILRELTGISDWRAYVVKLADLGGIDRGLVVVIQEETTLIQEETTKPADSEAAAGKPEQSHFDRGVRLSKRNQRQTAPLRSRLVQTRYGCFGNAPAATAIAQLMPHGGPRVIQKIVSRLIELGAAIESNPPAKEIYPEASSGLEADVLAILAQAASPAAIDLLLAQPRLWRDYLARLGKHGLFARETAEILARSKAFDRLVAPAMVVVCGRPNVGKSTLTNCLLGRAASLVTDLPGTTRDWVAGLTEFGGIAIRWMDTPGLRWSNDPIEQAAIEIAKGAIASADLLIAMRDPQIDWPQPGTLPREPDLWVVNKIDEPAIWKVGRAEATRESPLPISAATGAGLDLLQNLVLHRLGVGDLSPGCWAFSADLRRLPEAGDLRSLRAYAGIE